MNNKIYVKNISNTSVVVSAEGLRVKTRILPGKRFGFTEEDFEILNNHIGFRNLIENKFLQVEDPEIAIDSGLVAEEDFSTDENGEKVQIHAEDAEAIFKLLSGGSDLEVKELLAHSNKQRTRMIAQIAIECPGISYNKVKMISDASGLDIRKILMYKE